MQEREWKNLSIGSGEAVHWRDLKDTEHSEERNSVLFVSLRIF